ncbi:hypothetical protein STEG23_028883 [Scotinomys teguina]
MTVTPLGRDQDCSLKNREPDVPAPWFLDPGGWSKTAAVRLYFIFPGICTLSLAKGLHIDPEKVQRDEVVNYLGSRITTASVVPQKVELHKDHLHTLNDFQTLLGDTLNDFQTLLGDTLNDFQTLLGDIQWDQQDPMWVPERLVRRIPEDRKAEDVASMDDVGSAEPAVVDDIGPAVPPNGDRA